ncbi:MAG: hypothetical protein ACREMY_04340 [bacterium]
MATRLREIHRHEVAAKLVDRRIGHASARAFGGQNLDAVTRMGRTLRENETQIGDGCRRQGKPNQPDAQGGQDTHEPRYAVTAHTPGTPDAQVHVP